jgi:hypothetical protein
MKACAILVVVTTRIVVILVIMIADQGDDGDRLSFRNSSWSQLVSTLRPGFWCTWTQRP